MRPIKLFIYGTLLAAPVLRAVLGRPASLQAAQLAGYRRRSLRGLRFPGLIRQRDSTTAGAVVRVSVGELRRLDRYEDDHYERRPVQVELGDGRTVPAQAYVLLRRDRGLVGRAP